MTILADETDRCKRFKEGLRKEICSPVTASVEWTDFTKLVESAMRVNKSLLEEKIEKETSKEGRIGHPLWVSCEQASKSESRRFVPRVSGKGSFKP